MTDDPAELARLLRAAVNVALQGLRRNRPHGCRGTQVPEEMVYVNPLRVLRVRFFSATGVFLEVMIEELLECQRLLNDLPMIELSVGKQKHAEVGVWRQLQPTALDKP